MRTLVGIPCMGTVPVRFMTSLLAMRRVGSVQFEVTDHSLIYDARNRIARAAIEEGFDRVLWLDSDMVFEPDLMERLGARLDEGIDYVSGLYFKRKKAPEPVIFRRCRVTENGAPDTETYTDYPRDSLFEIEASGFGAVMTSTSLLRDVRDAYGALFTPIAALGEDMAFCLRARELGRKLWCDSGIRLGHVSDRIITEEDWDGWLTRK